MKGYASYIGDCYKNTGHLTPKEDLVFRELLDHRYATKGPLVDDASKLGMIIEMTQYTSEIVSILNEFFVLGDNGWDNKPEEEVYWLTTKLPLMGNRKREQQTD